MPRGAGIDGGKGAGAVEAGGVAEDGPSDPLARALRVPGNVTVGSFRFQQFFLMYAKLMAGLSDLKVIECETKPRAMQKAVIKAGNPSLEELDWAI